MARIHLYVRAQVSGDQAAIDEIAAVAARLKTLVGSGCDYSVVPDVVADSEPAPEPETAPVAEATDAVS